MENFFRFSKNAKRIQKFITLSKKLIEYVNCWFFFSVFGCQFFALLSFLRGQKFFTSKICWNMLFIDPQVPVALLAFLQFLKQSIKFCFFVIANNSFFQQNLGRYNKWSLVLIKTYPPKRNRNKPRLFCGDFSTKDWEKIDNPKKRKESNVYKSV